MSKATKTPATATRPSQTVPVKDATPSVNAPERPPGAPVRVSGETTYQECQLQLIDGTVVVFTGPFQCDPEVEIVGVRISPKRTLLLG